MFDTVSVDSCRILVQTLTHSLWQASVVALCCWLVLRSLPGKQSKVRYAMPCLGLLSVVFTTLLTVAVLTERQSEPAVTTVAQRQALPLPDSPRQNTRIEAASGESVRVTRDKSDVTQLEPQGANSLGQRSSDPVQFHSAPDFDWAVVLVGIWGLGVCVMLFRLIRIIVATRHLQSPGTPVDESLLNPLRELIADLSQRLNLRWPVKLVVSDQVSVPGIVGTFWPTLIMPPAMLTGVPFEQLRIVVAHELAHVKRFDFLVNLGQLLVESFLFFNPAVWWLSRQIRIEREACCDAIAVSATGSAVPVARTLLAVVDRLGQSIESSTATRTPVAAGVQSLSGTEPPDERTPLFDRICRIITPDQRPHIRIPWYTLLGVIAAYGLISIGLYEGADATIQVVQRVLSPKERIEKIEQLVAARGDLARSNGIVDTQNRTPPPTKKVTISGVIRTHDGSPVPAGIGLSGDVLTQLERSTSYNTQFHTRYAESAVEHRFEEHVSWIVAMGRRISSYMSNQKMESHRAMPLPLSGLSN